MALTKAVDTIDACQEIAQNTILEGNTKDATGWYAAAIKIWFALTNLTAHTGTRFIVQVSATTSGDEDWTDLYEWISITGTGNTEVITNNPLAAAGVTITVADTTGYTVNGSWRFLEDVSTFANSEWVFQTAYVANTSITIIDGVTREHAVNSIMNSIAKTYVAPIPDWTVRVRVLYDNTYDADGATVAVKASLTKVTAI
jgi:hypothetical protein